MGTLFDIAKHIEPWLIERGLSRTEVASGMSLLFGEDWNGLDEGELFRRLQARGYEVTKSMPSFADEIEGLVRGAIKLESFRQRLV
jgi:hypothetical protein